MKQFLKKFLSITLLISSAAAFAERAVVSTIQNRSQSRYYIHQSAGNVGHTDDVQYEKENWWGDVNAVVGWQQTFQDNRIAHALLGSDLNSTATTVSFMGGCNDRCDNGRGLLVQGSTVANRNANAWLADYLYLPTDFNSEIRIKPRIQSFFADFTFYLGLDEWFEGGYFQIHGPVVYTNWHLGFEESITSAGTAAGSYPVGYFAPTAIANTSLLSSVRSYMEGNAPFGGSNAFTDTATTPVTQTVTFQGLRFARMSGCGSRKETGFADLRAELGWNFWRNEDYHIGANIQAAAPTGNRDHAEHMFDAVVGNGKHWELGGAVTGHYVFYRSTDGDKHFGFYGDLNVTHMFKAKGMRTFDLKGKPNSKYMLATMYGANTQHLTGTGPTGTAATNQFADVYAPVANLTTLRINSSSSAQIDLVAKFNYTYKKFSMDLGYNFYYRSCEDFDCASDDCSPCDNLVNLCTSGQANTWALKGDSRMFGFPTAGVGVAPITFAGQAIPLSATDSSATIHGGNNLTATVTPTTSVNAGIDAPQIAFAGGVTTGTELFIAPGSIVGINTSIQPVFLSCSDIDIRGTRSMSNSIFTHLQYNFECNESWSPYIGVGAMVEFGNGSSGDDNNCNNSVTTVAATTMTGCDSDCDSCLSITPSYWGVWAKVGLSFN